MQLLHVGLCKAVIICKAFAVLSLKEKGLTQQTTNPSDLADTSCPKGMYGFSTDGITLQPFYKAGE